MKLTILGAGGTGAMIGAYAKKGGQHVCFLDPYEAHMKAVAEHGLDLTVLGKREIIQIDQATTKAEEIGVSDVVIVLCKGQHTREIVSQNMALFGSDTLVITFQNGVGNVDVLAEFFPERNIGFGVLRTASLLKYPGVVTDGRIHPAPVVDVTFGPAFPATEHAEKFTELEEAFNKGGITCKYTENTELKIWEKMFSNVLFNLPCGLCRVPMKTMLNHPQGEDLLKLLGREVVAVANAKGLPLDFDTCFAFFEVFRNSPHFPSAAQDVMKKRSTEVELLNGAVVREGKKYGIPTPYNEAVYLLSKVLEETYDQQF